MKVTLEVHGVGPALSRDAGSQGKVSANGFTLVKQVACRKSTIRDLWDSGGSGSRYQRLRECGAHYHGRF
jgi:hypothetical protein